MESIKEQMVQAVEQMKANAFAQDECQGKYEILALQGKGEIPWYFQLETTGFVIFVYEEWRLSAHEGYFIRNEDEWKSTVECLGPGSLSLWIEPGHRMEVQFWERDDFCIETYVGSAFVKMLKRASTREEMMILLDMFGDACAKDVAWGIVLGNYFGPHAKINPNLTPKAFEAFVDWRPDLFYEAIKSEKLLSRIFWHWKSKEVLGFVERALAYDRNYFRDYRDSLGNNCLHYFLMRFEISDCAERKMWSNNRCNYSVQSRIKTLLLENGVDADARNAAGYSYNDLAEYIEPYMYLATLYREEWDRRRPQDDDDDEYDESYSCVSYPTRMSNKGVERKKRDRHVRRHSRRRHGNRR